MRLSRSWEWAGFERSGMMPAYGRRDKIHLVHCEVVGRGC